MKSVFESMRDEFADLYKNYRISHFSMIVMKEIYAENMAIHKIDSFVIQDEDLDERIDFTTEDIEGCKENGKYQRVLAGTTLAVIYQLWEEKFRPEIANKYQLLRNDVKSDFFGDLRHVRQAIIHNNLQPISDLKKLKTLQFLGNETQLNLSSPEISQVYLFLTREIDRLEVVFSA